MQCSAVQQVAAVEKQIQQYQTQLQQYQNMLQNTAAPSVYIWDQASQVMNKLIAAQDTLNYYKNQIGGVDAYLWRYGDVSYYKTLPCFGIDNNEGSFKFHMGAETDERQRFAVHPRVDQD